MTRVLLTGASGFIGSHCLSMLSGSGHDVHAVTSRGCDPSDPSVSWHTADLLDPAQVRDLLREVRPSHLLHLAWFVSPGVYWSSAENVRWLQAGLDLLREFADSGGERVVVAGTGAEYAASRDPLLEGVTPLMPTTLYGGSKAALHLAATPYAREMGLSLAWGHIFHLYGPGERASRLVPAAIRAMLSGRDFRVDRPDDVRDFMHVEDVARAFTMLLHSDVRGDVNIASGVPTTILDLVRTIAIACDTPDAVSCVPQLEQAHTTVADTTRLNDEVGFVRQWPLSVGIEATVDWWRSNPGADR